jgi:hypothetical protein
MNFSHNTPDQHIHNKIKKANEEIESLKEQINFIYVKHTFYNTGLFIMGMTALTIYICSFNTTIDKRVYTMIEDIKPVLKKIEWEFINQSVYVINGKILMLFDNPLLKQ